MTDLNKEREAFEANEFVKTIIHKFEWSEEFNSYQIKDCVIKGNVFELIEAERDQPLLNGAWFGWQEKAKAQAVQNEIINEIQSWVAVKSFPVEDAHPDLPIIDANELAEFIEQLVKGESGADE
ncbi:hypothetical protein J9896_08665 [Acinetobacter baumannii]|uniref:hypothetical protein n=1 Tax=Acinetobacter baumannii TaxID=470 RepID=UPI001B32DB4D|nr:hypothetical protein [Acinetobacter baumannii]MBP4063471.1 hypothetical protein [Acinetobacter baumannii]